MDVRKITILLIIAFLIIGIGFSQRAFCQNQNEKFVLLILDSMDFEIADKIVDEKSSLGIMNVKAENLYKASNVESLIATIALGKRVKVREGLFKGVEKDKTGRLYINGYDEILKDIKDKDVDFSREIRLFGEYMKRHGITTGYIGNDPSSLLAQYKDGYIEYGENKIEYNINWLKDKTNEMFKNVDILVIAYDINNDSERLDIIRDYISEVNDYFIMIFPKNIEGDINIKWNTTLTPIIYRTPYSSGGIIESETTKREGIITNLDIFPNIANIYGIESEFLIGNNIIIKDSNNSIDEIRYYFIELLNLNIIKYLSHGIVVILQLYIIINVKKRKDLGNPRYKNIMESVIVGIFLSFILGILKIHRIIPLYFIILISISILIPALFRKRLNDIIGFFSILTNITILLGIFAYKNIIYDSYIGYNNIVAGGRFYGLNNEIMGVLIVTTIITFYYLSDKIKDKNIQTLFLLLYFPIIIIALSAKIGANLGGYLTAIALFMMMVYITILNRKVNKRNIVVLLGIGLAIFILNIYIDLSSVEKSHAGRLLVRANILGYRELIDILSKKVKQLLLMISVPPWSFIFIGQLYFIINYYIRDKVHIEDIKSLKSTIRRKSLIIFITSFVALIINDTGVIAFAYMNTYLISIITGLHNAKQKEHYQR